MDKDVEKKLSSAKIQLGLHYPFIGTLVYGMNIVESKDMPMPTAATDGKRIYIHPEFVKELSVRQVMFLLAHECLHVAFMHCLRLYDREQTKWNIATDIVINQFLVEDGIGDFIKGCMHDKKLYYKGDESADGVYAILPDSMTRQFDALLKPNGDKPITDSELRELEAETRMKVAQAAAVAKAASKMTENVKRLVGELLSSKVNWRKVLQQFVVKCKDDMRSWCRPNRRFLCQNIYVPSRDGEAMGEIAVAIDCSGSIDDEQLQQFASEIRALAEDTNPERVHVIYFDSAVCHYDTFERYEQVTVSPHGGGGTAFSPVFRFMEQQGIFPECCVFLTDLYSGDFGSQPDYPVLWVTTGSTDAPFGEVVEMKD